jgi:prophage antirepressor-like protein
MFAMRELTFQETTLRVVEIDGQAWVGAADIARALGYNRADKVTRLYERHSAEFRESMTRVVMLETADPQTGVLLNKTASRVFSLRGAHLVAMFARTANGQAFRRWVLDLIEQNQQANIAPASLVQAYFKAQVKLEAQEQFASMCGRGLSEHTRKKPPLEKLAQSIWERLQPSLFNTIEAAH